MVAYVDRANIVFEKEVALRLVIIARNMEIIFMEPLNDPYLTPNSGGNTVGNGTQILNGLVGGSNYEVGHIFLPCTDVGGVAAGQICSPGKGNGVTCYGGIGVNGGTVGIFNHEVGHQMTAGHTWNYCPPNAGQLAAGSAFEPGSGSTIMSYSGACGVDNLGVSREDYYHSGTLEQILNYTNRDNSEAYICAEKIDVGNTNPVVEIVTPVGVTIPASTPFYLLGKATDKEANPMTYIWEQVDNSTNTPLGMPAGDCPLFRSYRSTINPMRLFPNRTSIYNKNFTDVKEFMPTYSRNMNFRFAVRDNNPMAPGVTMQDIRFKVNGDAGPFEVTEPASQVKFTVGKTYKIKWNVANTDKAPVNAKYVDILIGYGNVTALDFGTNNVVMVAERVQNDGEFDLFIPDRLSNTSRIIVRGHNNIFFNISSLVSIQETTKPGHYSTITDILRKSCIPAPVSYEITTKAIAGLTEKIKFEVVSGLPSGAVATFEKSEVAPGESNRINITLDNVTGSNEYAIVVRTFVPGVDTLDRVVYLSTLGTDLNNMLLKLPVAESVGVGPTQRYEWEGKPDAITYTLQVSTTPLFKAEDIVITNTSSSLFYVSEVYLDKSKIYYWRVLSSNTCGDGDWSRVRTFTTAALLCTSPESGTLNIPISGSGTPTLEAPIVVTQAGTINDINIREINITHSLSKDLIVSLISPKGTKSTLWTKKCNTQNVNVGLDDESNLFFQCPINSGRTYRPEMPLSVFNGEQMEGRWILKVEDTEVGGNGRFNDWTMELCANIQLNPPVLTRNNVLQIFPKDKRTIERTLLLTEDSNNTAAELQFTIVEAPKRGTLVLNNTPLEAGSIFTQDDIDKFILTYIHTAADEEDDNFSFVVTDGQGGYILVNDFIIEVDDAFPSKVDDAASLASRILVYPNPTDDHINIQVFDVEHRGMWSVTIMDMQGKVIVANKFAESIARISLASMPTGVYMAKITIDGKTAIKKITRS